MIVNHENSFSAINDEPRAVGDDREKASVYDVKVRFIALSASKGFESVLGKDLGGDME